MTIRQKSAFRLETAWTPATAAESLAYSLTLTNLSGKAVEGFPPLRQRTRPASIPQLTIEGGTLAERLSNHSEFAPPDGFVLEPGAVWTVTARGLSYGLRHWTDGANTAYVAFADGTTAPVAVEPTRAVGDNATLKRGAEIYPVPDQAPVPVSIVPWPQHVAVSGPAAPCRRGSTLSAGGCRGRCGGRRLWRARRQPVPVEGIVRPAAEGGLPVAALARRGICARGLCDRLFAGRRVGVGWHPRRPALRTDHARPDPARRTPSPRDVRVSGRRRDPRRAGARLARHRISTLPGNSTQPPRSSAS